MEPDYALANEPTHLDFIDAPRGYAVLGVMAMHAAGYSQRPNVLGGSLSLCRRGEPQRQNV